MEFKYDYLGRRVEKKVYSGSTGSWTLDTHLKFVYDGFEQIEELDGADSDAILKKRIWGIEKILADIHGENTYYALGDANKNISEYLDSLGNIQSHYEYSPFGKITQSSGSMQNDFDYRFSSEIFDSETKLVYYNYRYYSPELGRWLNRDPIGIKGGINLYGMVGNDAVNKWDILGLCSDTCTWDKRKKAWCCGGKECKTRFDCCEDGKITSAKWAKKGLARARCCPKQISIDTKKYKACMKGIDEHYAKVIHYWDIYYKETERQIYKESAKKYKACEDAFDKRKSTYAAKVFACKLAVAAAEGKLLATAYIMYEQGRVAALGLYSAAKDECQRLYPCNEGNMSDKNPYGHLNIPNPGPYYERYYDSLKNKK